MTSFTSNTGKESCYNSDSESSDSDDDNILEDSDVDIINSKYNLVFCELHNDKIHGKTPEDATYMNGQFLVISKFKRLDTKYLNEMSKFYNKSYKRQLTQITPHSIILNYSNIINKDNYIKPEIAECIYLTGSECICIVKTYWLRLIQRTWKRVYKTRCENNKSTSLLRGMLYKSKPKIKMD